jgi:ribulose-phosphate 3-epimerase
VGLSITLGFFVNAKFNFKVPKAKRLRAFQNFSLISFFSFSLNYSFYDFVKNNISYESSRIVSSSIFFLLGYLLHRRFSFKEYKKVGVAVYANGNEDIKGIYDKISFVVDFIHVDIVDKSFNSNAPDPATYRLETIKAFWPGKEVHCHIMSKTPKQWILKVADHVDTLIFHSKIDEDIGECLQLVKSLGKKAGLCLFAHESVESIAPHLESIDEIMILAINQPGRSGQSFNFKALERLQEINCLPCRNRIDVSVDGGVSDSNIQLLPVDKVVSGSYVLRAKDPLNNIMKLQTSAQYEVC